MEISQILDNLFFIILFGGTAMAALLSCIYLLLRKGNAFSTEVTPPIRLRHWAASFFAISLFEHIWWLLFYLYSGNNHSVFYVLVCSIDFATMMTTIGGTLLAMLQDRKRHFWPFIIATIPYAALLVLDMVYPEGLFLTIVTAYVVIFYVLFTLYMTFAVRQYRCWLRDNYADLEHKEVWQSYILIIVFSLFVIFYGFADNITISFIVQLISLVLFGILLWRVETLQQLDVATDEDTAETPAELEEEAPSTISSDIGQLLEKHCEGEQLYLQHDLSLSQLAQAIGTNHYYLSQYFTQKGLTYNAYINDLRIRHFINLYHEAVADERSFTAQQLAQQSGFRSYSTFGVAFKQRMGQTVTTWMRSEANREE